MNQLKGFPFEPISDPGVEPLGGGGSGGGAGPPA